MRLTAGTTRTVAVEVDSSENSGLTTPKQKPPMWAAFLMVNAALGAIPKPRAIHWIR